MQGQQGYREDYVYDAESRLSQVTTVINDRGTMQTFATTTEYDDQELKGPG
ncbi:MAG: hypothetical protein ACT4PZ_21890 [Panacagrimonas sp.]